MIKIRFVRIGDEMEVFYNRLKLLRIINCLIVISDWWYNVTIPLRFVLHFFVL